MVGGDEIIFADEYGTWMIPGDEKTFIQVYLHSLSIMATPDEFTEVVIPLLDRDSHESLTKRFYKSVVSTIMGYCCILRFDLPQMIPISRRGMI